MKFDLESTFKTLGLSLGLIAVFSAVLGFFGIELGLVLTIAGSMFGAQFLIGLLVDVLKWAGVVGDTTAGKWSAGLNLLGIVGIAVGLGLNPNFNFPKLDADLLIIAQFGTLIFGFIVQLAGTKNIHAFLTRGLGIWRFSYSTTLLRFVKHGAS